MGGWRTASALAQHNRGIYIIGPVELHIRPKRCLLLMTWRWCSAKAARGIGWI